MNNNFLNDPKPTKVPPFEKIKSFDDPKTYIIPTALMNAVKVAIFLGQPLLLTGEAGTGKTQLAKAIAHQFNLGEPEIFNTKTTSTARDMLYLYDSLAHFQYIQNHKEALTDADIEDKFIHYQALGNAIRNSGERKVVLIDEIDKAPRDFPNDLLDVLEQMWFEVPELDKVDDKKIVGNTANRPIVIITSNSEKNLPDAFLRRCVYFFIEKPSRERLIKILNTKFIEPKISDEDLKIWVAHFEKIREKIDRKKPATAELIYWVRALVNQKFDVNKLKEGAELTDDERLKLYSSYSILAKNTRDLEKITGKKLS